jgi:hypothetical protein
MLPCLSRPGTAIEEDTMPAGTGDHPMIVC